MGRRATRQRAPTQCYSTAQVELHRVNVEFAGPPSEAVDYLVGTLMHASAAVFGATIQTIKRSVLAAVGDLGVTSATVGPAHAGRGGVAICTQEHMSAVVDDEGIAIGSTDAGIAISGARGQSYTGRRGLSRSERGGLAVPGTEGRATGTYVVVGERSDAEVLAGPEAMFAAAVGSQVHARGFTFHTGADYEPRPPTGSTSTRAITHASSSAPSPRTQMLNASCSLTNHALIRYFLAQRPLCSAAAREHGMWWTHALRHEHGVLELPAGTREYLDEIRRPYRTGAG